MMADNTSGNVIRMGSYAKGGGAGVGSGTRAQELLNVCRDRLADHLTRSLHAMMEKTDDTLFSLADKAESNAIQSVYFDAMREVRIKRKDIEDGFRKHFLEECTRLIRREGDAAAGALSLEGSAGMSLVDHEDMEETLAVTNMVSKAGNHCREEISHLNLRVGILLDDPQLKTEDNPLGPTVVAESFRRACEVLEVDIKVRLIVLKLFEQKVIEDLQSGYRNVNQYLINNNVLPTILLRVNKHGRSAREDGLAGPGMTMQTPADGFMDADGYPDGEPDIFGLFRRYQVAGYGIPGGAVTPAGSGGAAVGAEVLNALTMIQQRQFAAVAATQSAPGEAPVGTGIVNIVRGVKTGEYSADLGHLDDMTIEIVAMLFDQILEDGDVPDAMKALICQLQIPVLKVALLDKSLFAKKSHPARRLVNDIARATIGWDQDSDREDGLYCKISEIVASIQQDFEDDVGLFERLHGEFHEYLAAHAREVEANVEESARLLKGREKLAIAKGVVQEEIDRRVGDEGISRLVRLFLSHHWKNLLLVVHVTDGIDSPAWKRDVATMDDLVWSVLPKKTREDKEILLNMLPGLLDRLRAGMATLSLPDAVQQQFLTRLASFHGKAINEGSRLAGDLMDQEVVAEGSEEHILFADEEAQPMPPAGEVRDEAGETVVDEPAPEAEAKAAEDVMLAGSAPALAGAGAEEALQELAAGNRDEIMKMVASGLLDVEEITLSGHDDGLGEEECDLYTGMARDLALGSWVEFRDESGASVRERLSWVSEVAGVYMFTNRQGRKTSEKRLHELAAAFRSGAASLVEEVPLFDKAVSGLMHSLRSQSRAG